MNFKSGNFALAHPLFSGSLQTIMYSFYSCMTSTNQMMGYSNEEGMKRAHPLLCDSSPDPMFASARIELCPRSDEPLRGEGISLG